MDLKTDTQKILDAIHGLGGRVDGLSERMGKVESCLDGVVSQQKMLIIHVDSLDSRLDSLDSRFNFLGSRIDSLGSRMDSLDSQQGELIEMVQTFSETVDDRFDVVSHHLGSIDQRFVILEKEQARTRSVMVDKDYFDRKLADFKGDVVAFFRKGDQRVNALVRTLQRKRTLTTKESETVLAHAAFVPSHS